MRRVKLGGVRSSRSIFKAFFKILIGIFFLRKRWGGHFSVVLSLCAVFSRPSILSRCNPRPPTWSSRARRGPSHTRRVRKGTFFCLSSSPLLHRKWFPSHSACCLSPYYCQNRLFMHGDAEYICHVHRVGPCGL